jgi:hypothetical protein
LSRYLPAFPYQDNPVLHVYAGLIKLFLAQPEDEQPKELFADGKKCQYLNNEEA